jgi:hypothetical protein
MTGVAEHKFQTAINPDASPVTSLERVAAVDRMWPYP